MTGRPIILATGLAGVIAAAAPAFISRPAIVIWNTTASAPEGLYKVRSVDQIRVGQWVAVEPPPRLADWLARRGAAPKGVLLIKRVAALAPSTVCWSHGQVRLDGKPVAVTRRHDRAGRPLPFLTGCRRLNPHQVFLLNEARDSLDGRYFGPLPRGAVVGQVTPIWIVRDAAHDG